MIDEQTTFRSLERYHLENVFPGPDGPVCHGRGSHVLNSIVIEILHVPKQSLDVRITF